MRLTCPNCGAQYEVDDRVIPAEGRDVECSACRSVWFQRGRERAPVLVVGRAEPPAPVTPRAGLSEGVLAILREEAAREAAARVAARERRDRAAEEGRSIPHDGGALAPATEAGEAQAPINPAAARGGEGRPRSPHGTSAGHADDGLAHRDADGPVGARSAASGATIGGKGASFDAPERVLIEGASVPQPSTAPDLAAMADDTAQAQPSERSAADSDDAPAPEDATGQAHRPLSGEAPAGSGAASDRAASEPAHRVDRPAPPSSDHDPAAQPRPAHAVPRHPPYGDATGAASRGGHPAAATAAPYADGTDDATLGVADGPAHENGGTAQADGGDTAAPLTAEAGIEAGLDNAPEIGGPASADGYGTTAPSTAEAGSSSRLNAAPDNGGTAHAVGEDTAAPSTEEAKALAGLNAAPDNGSASHAVGEDTTAPSTAQTEALAGLDAVPESGGTAHADVEDITAPSTAQTEALSGLDGAPGIAQRQRVPQPFPPPGAMLARPALPDPEAIGATLTTTRAPAPRVLPAPVAPPRPAASPPRTGGFGWGVLVSLGLCAAAGVTYWQAPRLAARIPAAAPALTAYVAATDAARIAVDEAARRTMDVLTGWRGR